MDSGGRLKWIVLGGLAFWLPYIIQFAVFRLENIWLLNAGSLGGLVALGFVGILRHDFSPRWGWVWPAFTS
jgi:hypothetical protein